MSEMEVQTRSNSDGECLRFFGTLKEAFEEARRDEGVWKNPSTWAKSQCDL